MQLGQATGGSSYSIGASIWQMLNPAQVQAEDVALGQPVQTTAQIETQSAGELAAAANPFNPTSDLYTSAAQSITSAAQATGSAISAGASDVVSAAASAGTVLALVAIAVIVYEVSSDAKAFSKHQARANGH